MCECSLCCSRDETLDVVAVLAERVVRLSLRAPWTEGDQDEQDAMNAEAYAELVEAKAELKRHL